MLNVFGIKDLILTTAALVILVSGVATNAQDLGSSSNIFRAPNPSSKSKTTPKTTKPKTATVKKPTSKPSTKTNSRTTAKSKTGQNQSREVAGQARTRPTVVEPIAPSNVVITVGNAANGNYDELFEQSVDEGNTARDERDYPRAETAYRRAQGMKPKDARAVYGLGNIFADQQRWEEAERAYRQAVMLDPDGAGAYIALSYVLTQPIVGSNVSDRYAEAEKTARKAIALDPQNAFAQDQLGVSLELNGIISEETQNAYRRAIAIEPEFALAYAHLGRLLRRNGKSTESVEAYRKAIQFSNDVPTMILVADVMQSQQKFIESEQLLRRALSVDAKNPTALYMLGRALTTRGEFDEAEKVLRKSVEVSPNSFVSYTLLSSLYLRRARLDDAEKTLGQALGVVSPNEKKRLAQEFEMVGDAFMKIGKAKDAQRLYKQAMALDASKTILTEKLANMR